MDAFADTLHFTVRCSAYARRWVSATHGLAAMVCAALAWYRPWLWPFGVLIAWSFWYGWRRANLRTAASICHLRWQADGRWRWQTRDGRSYIGRCIAADVHGAMLVVLTLRADGQAWRRRRCALFCDALPASDHRRLRARLRVAPPAATGAPAADA